MGVDTGVPNQGSSVQTMPATEGAGDETDISNIRGVSESNKSKTIL